MTLRFIVARILRELIELAGRDGDAELVDGASRCASSPLGAGLRHESGVVIDGTV